MVIFFHMLTSCNGNTFRVSGPMWRESTCHRWISLTRGQLWGALMFPLLSAWTSCWTNCIVDSDLRCHDIHLTSLQYKYSQSAYDSQRLRKEDRAWHVFCEHRFWSFSTLDIVVLYGWNQGNNQMKPKISLQKCFCFIVDRSLSCKVIVPCQWYHTTPAKALLHFNLSYWKI